MAESPRISYTCSECGEEAATVELGASVREITVTFLGAVHFWVNEEAHRAVQQALAENNKAELYWLLRRLDPERVSFHCPDCDRSYCQKHWNPQIQFDDEWSGWYDCTYGTCPKGHRHILDD